MPSTLELSVVVPTSGRPTSLARLLDALSRQPDPGVGWELVVVDNHLTRDPDVASLVEQAAAPARVVHEPRPGASPARNRGVAAARGTWTALLDDDVDPAPDWLASVVRHLDDTLDGFGGPVRLDPTVRLPRWMDDELAGFVTFLDLGPTARPLRNEEYVLTANAVIRTAWLERVPFDASLGPRPGAHLTNDDLDVVARLRAQGARLAWRPDVVVVHDAPPSRLTTRWLASRAFHQGRSDRRLEDPNLASARLGGLRTGWWHLQDRVRGSLRTSPSPRAAAAHVLAESARAAGWWVETVAHLRRGTT